MAPRLFREVSFPIPPELVDFFFSRYFTPRYGRYELIFRFRGVIFEMDEMLQCLAREAPDFYSKIFVTFAVLMEFQDLNLISPRAKMLSTHFL